MLDQITPVIITFNEEANIGRTLGQLEWAKNVVVMDSFSTDQTESKCRAYKNVTFVQRQFDDFASQCTAAINHASINTEWVMSLDADYFVPSALKQELDNLEPDNSVDGYRASFEYCINGERIGTSLYPPRIVLARHKQLTFRMDGHAHRRAVPGEVLSLKNIILHDDRKAEQDWQNNQKRYAAQEAEKILAEPVTSINSSAWVRKHFVYTPFVVAFYLGVICGMLFCGSNARLYMKQRIYFERLLQKELKMAKKSLYR